MKKFIIFFICCFLFVPVTAKNADLSVYCPQVQNSDGFRISKITGMKWLSEKIAQSIIKKELKKETKGKFRVKISSTGTKDLINGNFNSLSMVGKNLNVEGVHISEFTSNTVCGYNSVKINKDDISFRENMVLNYELKINNDALSKTITDTKFTEIIRGMGFPINSITSDIRNNKVYFIFEIPTFVTKPIKLTLSSGVTVKNGRLQLTGLQSDNTNINIKNLTKIIEKINPITFTSDIMNNNNSVVSLDSAKIINDTVVIKGLVLIPKNVQG